MELGLIWRLILLAKCPYFQREEKNNNVLKLHKGDAINIRNVG